MYIKTTGIYHNYYNLKLLKYNTKNTKNEIVQHIYILIPQNTRIYIYKIGTYTNSDNKKTFKQSKCTYYNRYISCKQNVNTIMAYNNSLYIGLKSIYRIKWNTDPFYRDDLFRCELVENLHTKTITDIVKFKNNYLVSASNDKSICISSIKDKKKVATLEKHIKPVKYLLTLYNRFVISASEKTIYLWDTENLGFKYESILLVNKEPAFIKNIYKTDKYLIYWTLRNIKIYDHTVLLQCKTLENVALPLVKEFHCDDIKNIGKMENNIENNAENDTDFNRVVYRKLQNYIKKHNEKINDNKTDNKNKLNLNTIYLYFTNIVVCNRFMFVTLPQNIKLNKYIFIIDLNNFQLHKYIKNTIKYMDKDTSSFAYKSHANTSEGRVEKIVIFESSNLILYTKKFAYSDYLFCHELYTKNGELNDNIFRDQYLSIKTNYF